MFRERPRLLPMTEALAVVPAGAIMTVTVQATDQPAWPIRFRVNGFATWSWCPVPADGLPELVRLLLDAIHAGATGLPVFWRRRIGTIRGPQSSGIRIRIYRSRRRRPVTVAYAWGADFTWFHLAEADAAFLADLISRRFDRPDP